MSHHNPRRMRFLFFLFNFFPGILSWLAIFLIKLLFLNFKIKHFGCKLLRPFFLTTFSSSCHATYILSIWTCMEYPQKFPTDTPYIGLITVYISICTQNLLLLFFGSKLDHQLFNPTYKVLCFLFDVWKDKSVLHFFVWPTFFQMIVGLTSPI